MSDKGRHEIGLLSFIKNELADLIYLNGIIATELIKITENTAAIRHGEEFFENSSCGSEHDALNKKVMEIVRRYKDKPEDYEGLEKHVLKHLK